MPPNIEQVDLVEVSLCEFAHNCNHYHLFYSLKGSKVSFNHNNVARQTTIQNTWFILTGQVACSQQGRHCGAGSSPKVQSRETGSGSCKLLQLPEKKKATTKVKHLSLYISSVHTYRWHLIEKLIDTFIENVSFSLKPSQGNRYNLEKDFTHIIWEISCRSASPHGRQISHWLRSSAFWLLPKGYCNHFCYSYSWTTRMLLAAR